MTHLLSQTTGWGGFHNQYLPDAAGSCAKGKPGGVTWEECLVQVSQQPFQYAPGKFFQYGAWHFMVAGAMVQAALGQPLTMEAWIQTVKTHLYVPVGIVEEPRYGGCVDENPYVPFPFTGPATRIHAGPFPYLGGGMIMSGRQWQKIAQALYYGNLLTPASQLAYITDHTMGDVTFAAGDQDILGPEQIKAGSWHYTLGSWIACDAAAAAGYPAASLEAEEVCGVAPQPKIVHSVGFQGEYVYIDLTNNYYGVFVASWTTDLWHFSWTGWGTGLAVLCALLVSCLCCCCLACCLHLGFPEKKNPEKTQFQSLNENYDDSDIE